MKKLVLTILFMIATISLFAGDVFVHGYFRSDGTYVRPHYRSAPDGNPWNNWSTIGNINPYTGRRGYKNPFNSNSLGIGSGSGIFRSNGYSNPLRW